MTATGVASLYADFLDGWLVDQDEPAEADEVVAGAGTLCSAQTSSWPTVSAPPILREPP